jgi:hypothetical protein
VDEVRRRLERLAIVDAATRSKRDAEEARHGRGDLADPRAGCCLEIPAMHDRRGLLKGNAVKILVLDRGPGVGGLDVEFVHLRTARGSRTIKIESKSWTLGYWHERCSVMGTHVIYNTFVRPTTGDWVEFPDLDDPIRAFIYCVTEQDVEFKATPLRGAQEVGVANIIPDPGETLTWDLATWRRSAEGPRTRVLRSGARWWES